MDQPANAEAELKGSRMDVTLDIALIKSRSDSMFPNTIGAINYRNSSPFFAGTAVTNSSNLTVIVAGVNWTTNPWAYVARLRPVRPMSRNNLPFGPFADA